MPARPSVSENATNLLSSSWLLNYVMAKVGWMFLEIRNSHTKSNSLYFTVIDLTRASTSAHKLIRSFPVRSVLLCSPSAFANPVPFTHPQLQTL